MVAGRARREAPAARVGTVARYDRLGPLLPSEVEQP